MDTKWTHHGTLLNYNGEERYDSDEDSYKLEEGASPERDSDTLIILDYTGDCGTVLIRGSFQILKTM